MAGSTPRVFGTEHVSFHTSAPVPLRERDLEEGGKIDNEKVLLEQGAEARVFKTLFDGQPAILKERFPKSYRHPILDAKLNKQRTSQEARSLGRCKRAGLGVPAVLEVDVEGLRLVMEFIDAPTVKRVLWDEETDAETKEDAQDGREEGSPEETPTASQAALARLIGAALGKLHGADIIHGDLTTSNMLLRPPMGSDSDGSIVAQDDTERLVFIDFGLSASSSLVEDKAVDLYVLERAFLSTHPRTEALFAEILAAYAASDGAGAVLKRLEEVRLRGRKKVAFG
jgi:TP53 regulating kinase and related kinases